MSVLGEASNVVLRLLSGAAIAVGLCICYQVLRIFFQVYNELFLLCGAVLSRRWLTKSKNLRLTPYLCETADMDADTLSEVFSFNKTVFKEVSKLSGDDEKIFLVYKKALLSYTYAFLFRDRLDGSLRGTAMLGINRREKYTTIKIGLSMFQTEYRGGPWLKLTGAYLCIKELLFHPFTPLYGVLKASSYKSYLLVQAHRECYPHHSKKTPEIYKKIAEDFVAESYASDEYDRETFILHRRVGMMNDHVAPIYDRHLQNPHIKFYNERNVDWRKGDQLVTVWRISWLDYIDGIIIMIKQFLYRKKRNISEPRGISGGGNENIKHAQFVRKRTLERGLTFQDMQANFLSVKYSVYEWGDEKGREVPPGRNTVSVSSPGDLNGVNFEF